MVNFNIPMCIQRTQIMLELLLCIFACNGFINTLHAESITTDEEQRLRKYVNTVDISSAIGQLLIVGVPGDIKNYQNNPHILKLFKDVGVGGILLNAYNIRQFDNSNDDATTILSIRSFIENLQSLSLNSASRLPLFVCANFENSELTSIPDGLKQMPSGMTLSSTHNPEMIYNVGRALGIQLKAVGVNTLLGPVLDIYKSEPGKITPYIDNRSFGSSPNIVFSVASHYLKGLKEEGIFTIGKHFPGLGGIKENPHYFLPSFEGSAKQLDEELYPYRKVSNYIDGVMTSHIKMSLLDASNTPVTFSRSIVTDLIRNKNTICLNQSGNICGLNFTDKLIMTDDLCGMFSIDKYMNEKRMNFGDVAVEAFKAGHDLLLFAHIEVPRSAKRSLTGKFTFNSLYEVKAALLSYIQSSEANKEKFRESLYRILKSKLIFNKRYKSLNPLFPYDVKTAWHVAGNDQLDDYLPISEKGGINKYLSLIYDNATIIINKNANFIISDGQQSRIAFVIDETAINKFKHEFSNYQNRYTFFSNPKDKHGKMEVYKKEFLRLFNDNDLFIITINNIDDVNLIDHLWINNEISFRKKMIIFIHQNPSALKNELIHCSTTIGNFSRDTMAYDSDIKVLQGSLTPHSIENLPVTLNQISDVNRFKPMDPAYGFVRDIYFTTLTEKEQANHIDQLNFENIILRRFIYFLGIFSIFCLSIIISSIDNYSKLKLIFKRESNRHGLFGYTFLILSSLFLLLIYFTFQDIISIDLGIGLIGIIYIYNTVAEFINFWKINFPILRNKKFGDVFWSIDHLKCFVWHRAGWMIIILILWLILNNLITYSLIISILKFFLTH